MRNDKDLVTLVTQLAKGKMHRDNCNNCQTMQHRNCTKIKEN